VLSKATCAPAVYLVQLLNEDPFSKKPSHCYTTRNYLIIT